jgi:prepilin-type N-terminal cleavage/methylation domain-containing protein
MKKMKRREGFTLTELVVVLAILGILLFLAVPRYLGPRKSALVAEGDHVIQELKAMAWGYYQQHNDFSNITLEAVGFQPPGTACWTFLYVNPAPTVVKIIALANPSGRTQCAVLDPTDRIGLFLNNDGSSMRLAPWETL